MFARGSKRTPIPTPFQPPNYRQFPPFKGFYLPVFIFLFCSYRPALDGVASPRHLAGCMGRCSDMHAVHAPHKGRRLGARSRAREGEARTGSPRLDSPRLAVLTSQQLVIARRLVLRMVRVHQDIQGHPCPGLDPPPRASPKATFIGL